jgi:hypothetical protein
MVSIDDELHSATVIDSATLRFVTPSHAEGFADVKVVNPDGLSDSRAGGLYYIPLPEGEEVPEPSQEIGDSAAGDTSDDESLGGDSKPGVGGTCSSAKLSDWSWVALVGLVFGIRRRRR